MNWKVGDMMKIYAQHYKDQERPLDPPDDVIDYVREEEQIENERSEAADKGVWEALWGKDLDALTKLLKEKK